MQSLKDLRTLAADAGWRVALMFVVHRLLESLSGGRARLLPYVYVAQPLGIGGPSPRPDPAVWIGRLQPGDDLATQVPRDAGERASRWARGGRCFAASVGGTLAGQIWFESGVVDDDEVRCAYRLPDGLGVWDFDVWVAPRFRMGRTMSRLWRHAGDSLGAEGVRWTFSRISSYNAASLRSHARLGAVTVRHATFLLIGPLQLMWSDAAPALRLSWGWRGRPLITLSPPLDTGDGRHAGTQTTPA